MLVGLAVGVAVRDGLLVSVRLGLWVSVSVGLGVRVMVNDGVRVGEVPQAPPAATLAVEVTAFSPVALITAELLKAPPQAPTVTQNCTVPVSLICNCGAVQVRVCPVRDAVTPAVAVIKPPKVRQAGSTSVSTMLAMGLPDTGPLPKARRQV